VTAPVLVAASHGTSDPAGQRAVAALVTAVAATAPAITVAEAFVDVQQPDVPAVLASVSRHPVVIVPLLLSAGYHVRVDLSRVAGAAPNPEVVVAAALGPDPRLVSLLERRLSALPLEPDDEIVLAAAGSSDARAVEDCRAMAEALGERISRSVTAAFISAAQGRGCAGPGRRHGPGRRRDLSVGARLLRRSRGRGRRRPHDCAAASRARGGARRAGGCRARAVPRRSCVERVTDPSRSACVGVTRC
jgi:hypothetical protein